MNLYHISTDAGEFSEGGIFSFLWVTITGAVMPCRIFEVDCGDL